MDDTSTSDWRGRTRGWLQATPAEAAGLVLLLLGAVAATGLFVWQAAQRPEGPANAAAGLPGDAADGLPGEPSAGPLGPGGDGPTGASAGLAGNGQAASHDRAHQDTQGLRHGVDADPGASRPGAGGDTAGPEPAELVVHVTGAVQTPGVVTLRGGARVADAVRAAGGASDDAALEHLNLARVLHDGEHVHLPRQGEDPPPATVAPPGEAGTAPPRSDGAGEGTAADGRVDLNHATEELLQSLPGIGPSKSAAIVRHREEHGPFAVPGDLRDVPGIGEKTFQQLADRVTVS
ncbi:ComEA family DNA-binding protein [Egicoccus halophilus]|uniref:Competence protein ComEA n=1 Tax=Egicoccus halophilus TaxID=1670830 RepID=A0A8J3AED7_9ACTN|nr:helix-hairpin-helix domain-containing protein [Egicoccus halophilus]GGI06905.1 competence protein ComEA [Egicoccus halophilus]